MVAAKAMIAATTCWQRPPQALILSDDELHLWRFNLDCPEPEQELMLELLTPDEIARAKRLLDPMKRKQFIVARGCLRQILGTYLIIDPRQIRFQYNKQGKPALANSQPASLSFNLSHSWNLGVLAVVKDSAVGIDIEKIEAALNFSQLAERYFTKQEQIQLRQYPPERRRRGFYRLWTQKEALLKAAGGGFQKDSATDEQLEIGQWSFKILPVAPAFVCSIATKQNVKLLHKFHLPG